MSAPTTERTATVRPTEQPGTRRSAGVPAPRKSGGTAGGAVGRAYARRAGRTRRMTGEDAAGSAGRSRFVLLVMALLGVGLVLSLWLSTTAAADSYRLDAARSATQDLSERSETLRTEIAAMQAPPALAKAAQQMGMVPASDVARLVPLPGGSVQVVGTPKAAVAPAPPAPAPGTVVAPGQPPAPGQPGAAAPDASQPGAAPPGAEYQAAPVQPAQPPSGQPAQPQAAPAPGQPQAAQPQAQGQAAPGAGAAGGTGQ